MRKQKITVYFNSNDLSEDSFRLLVEAATLSPGDVLDLSDLSLEVQAYVGLEEFDDDDIASEFESRFGDTDTASQTYRLMAAGDMQHAMEIMADGYSFNSPEHERKVAACIARGRTKEALHAES